MENTTPNPFTLLARDPSSKARRVRLFTARGTIEPPISAATATMGTATDLAREGIAGSVEPG